MTVDTVDGSSDCSDAPHPLLAHRAYSSFSEHAVSQFLAAHAQLKGMGLTLDPEDVDHHMGCCTYQGIIHDIRYAIQIFLIEVEGNYADSCPWDWVHRVEDPYNPPADLQPHELIWENTYLAQGTATDTNGSVDRFYHEKAPREEILGKLDAWMGRERMCASGISGTGCRCA